MMRHAIETASDVINVAVVELPGDDLANNEGA